MSDKVVEYHHTLLVVDQVVDEKDNCWLSKHFGVFLCPSPCRK